jgi:hypothetical protein
VVVRFFPLVLGASGHNALGGEPTYGTLTLVDLGSVPGTSELDTSPTLDDDRAPGLFRAAQSSSGGGGGGASHYAQTASLAALGECLVSLVRNANALEAEALAATAEAGEAADGSGGGVQLDRLLRQFRHTAQVRRANREGALRLLDYE